MAEVPAAVRLAADEAPADLLANAAWQVAGPAPVSVVVPFLNYDVLPLARRLLQLAGPTGVPVPLIFVDDGSPDPAFRQALWALLKDAAQPCLLASLPCNVGRARVRNILCRLACTPYLLYLDADMWPDRDDFLQRYLGWIADGTVDVIYGGRSVDKVVLTGPQYRLHRQMTQAREALPATVRRQSPAFHFYSCNFVVRREILDAYPLDEQFTGWGWEDMEWASRVAGKYAIRHEDNPASHLGLLTAPQILKKYDESIGNFRLMLARRPDIVAPTALFRVARVIGRLGLGPAVGTVARHIATAAWLPNAMRLQGLMFYKAALYAPHARDANV